MQNTTRTGAARPSRRSFVSALVGGSLIAGWSALARPRHSSAQDALPVFTGSWRDDETTRDAYAQDYGQIVHERPLAVLRPGSIEDIVRVVRYARRRGLTIAARGRGHQPFGQAQVRGGIVVDMRSLANVHALSADRVDVAAGAEWRTVIQATAQQRLTPPVLTAYQGLTVGGTLSIGGIGTATARHGAQVDQALELEVVTGEGDVVRCSEQRHPDLFEAVLAGQGQCAIITRAVLRLVPLKPIVREYMLRYPDLPTLLEDQAALLRDDRFDGVVGLNALGEDGAWAFALSALRQYTLPDAPDDAALTAGLRALPGPRQTRDVDYVSYLDELEVPQAHSHADLGLLIPGREAAQFLTDMLPRLRAEDLGMAPRMRMFFWNRSSFSRPLMRMPKQEHVVYMAMLRAETSDPQTIARLLAGNRTLFDANRALGGTLYPYSALELTRGDWRRHYGEAWRKLASAKRRYDPDNVFASGPDVFR